MPADSLLIGLTGPVLAMEFLENGTWGQIMNRILREDIHLPNRMLWSIFLCREFLAPIYLPTDLLVAL